MLPARSSGASNQTRHHQVLLGLASACTRHTSRPVLRLMTASLQAQAHQHSRLAAELSADLQQARSALQQAQQDHAEACAGLEAKCAAAGSSPAAARDAQDLRARLVQAEDAVKVGQLGMRIVASVKQQPV